MKYLAAWLLLATVSAARAEAPREAAPASATVVVQSEARDLAHGYRQGFTALSRTPVTLSFARNGVTYVLDDVRDIKDADGILIVKLGTGITYLLNPRDIIVIADGALPKARP